MITFLLFVLLGGAAGFVYTLRQGGGASPLTVSNRIGRHGLVVPVGDGDLAHAVSEVIAPSRERQAQSQMSKSVETLIARGRMGQALYSRLERAGLKMTPGEFISLCLAITLGGCALGLVVKGVLGLLIMFVVSLGGPWVYLSRRVSKRRKRFVEQLADVTQMMGNSLRSGFSIMQAMELVGQEGPVPACDEFERTVTEVKLGLPIEVALEHLRERMPGEDLELMVVAISVQRQIGGNLAEILNVISATIRDRVRFQRDLRALTAQARYSSYIITCLPIAVGIIINFIDHPYEKYLYTTLLGNVMLGVAGCMVAAGYFFLNRIAKIEV